MPLEPPDLDPKDEDQKVADVVDAFPAELSDRNKSATSVKLTEGLGTFYGLIGFHAGKVPAFLRARLLERLGITPRPASKATVTLTFASVDDSGRDIPAGTVVTTGGTGATKFATYSAIGSTDAGWTGSPVTIEVEATAVEAGTDGNVGANTLTGLEVAIAGVESVTNSVGADGGTDVETLAELLERASSFIRDGSAQEVSPRAITTEGFEVLAASVDGVERATVFVSGPGAVVIPFLADDLNETPSNTLKSAVDALDQVTAPGLVVFAFQPAVRLVEITSVEIAHADSADTSAVKSAIELELFRYITAVDIFDDGEQVGTAWPWGATLYVNEVISRLSKLDGVKRVGTVKYKTSDDYGATWSVEATLDELAAGASGDDRADIGLLHWAGDDYPGHGGLAVVAI